MLVGFGFNVTLASASDTQCHVDSLHEEKAQMLHVMSRALHPSPKIGSLAQRSPPSHKEFNHLPGSPAARS